MNTKYSPGLHYLATLHTSDAEALKDMEAFKVWLSAEIQALGLTQAGEVWHQFPQAGFTAAVALTESHISIHTWPEFQLATFDVFLSNFSRRNNDTVLHLAQGIASFFNARLSNIHQIER
ncbi:MAG: S-adenosylmethionine decarboxylase [Bacteroidia bacterium]|jgi:S-adenosylmethionine decarboxylase|nr:S-adenosylmethionine decarboxylase [Bacteroidia bacterium]